MKPLHLLLGATFYFVFSAAGPLRRDGSRRNIPRQLQNPSNTTDSTSAADDSTPISLTILPSSDLTETASTSALSSMLGISSASITSTSETSTIPNSTSLSVSVTPSSAPIPSGSTVYTPSKPADKPSESGSSRGTGSLNPTQRNGSDLTDTPLSTSFAPSQTPTSFQIPESITTPANTEPFAPISNTSASLVKPTGTSNEPLFSNSTSSSSPAFIAPSENSVSSDPTLTTATIGTPSLTSRFTLTNTGIIPIPTDTVIVSSNVSVSGGFGSATTVITIVLPSLTAPKTSSPPLTSGLVNSSSLVSTTNIAASPVVTSIPTVLPAPSVISSATPEQYKVNLSKAKSYNNFFLTIGSSTKCTSGQIACITGNVGNCNAQGAFDMTSCGTGMQCFALPMNTTQGVFVGCFDKFVAGNILGDTGKPTGLPSSTEVVPSSTSLESPATLSTSGKQAASSSITSGTTIVLSTRPSTTAIITTGPDTDTPPAQVTTTAPLKPFSPSSVDAGLSTESPQATLPKTSPLFAPTVTQSQDTPTSEALGTTTQTIDPETTRTSTLRITKTQTASTNPIPSQDPAEPDPITIGTTTISLQPQPTSSSLPDNEGGDDQPGITTSELLVPTPSTSVGEGQPIFLTILPGSPLEATDAAQKDTITVTVTKTERIREQETVTVTSILN